jgi:alpha-ribazole phosphatase
MFASVGAGVRSLEPSISAFFLLPVDLPLVKPSTIKGLLHTHRNGDAKLIYPCFHGHRGHPPLIASACVVDLPRAWEGGFRAYLRRYDQVAQDLAVTDEAVLLDCDTPEDYRRLLAYGSRAGIPTLRECEAIWDRYGLPEPVRRHCRMVGELAGRLAGHLNCAGLKLNGAMIMAAGYLHDLAKGQHDHARVGAGILADLGYGRIAPLVAAHRDIQAEAHSLDESGLLYFADKFLQGDHLVTLDKRFSPALHKFAGQPAVLNAIAKRRQDARIIQDRLEAVLGISWEELLHRHGGSLGPAAAVGPRRIYLVRHGAVASPGSGKRYLGQLEVPLSAAGRQQAETLKEKLRQIPLTAVYCSDLRRARETAEIIAETRGLTPITLRDLREISLGDWENLTFDEVKLRYPEAYAARGRDFRYFRPPGGESFLDCAHRVLPAFYAALASAPGDLLIIGHAGVNRILLSLAQGRSLADLFDIPQEYGCLNLITYRDFKFKVETLDGIIPQPKGS